MGTAVAAGVLFGLSLIVVIGPQNTYLLRAGIRRRHVAVVVAICTASDLVLIAAGTGGAGAVLEGHAWLLRGVRVGGAIFLLAYALLAARRAARAGRSSEPSCVDDAEDSDAIAGTVATTLALTWLNPGVYLDTVLLLGSVANTHVGVQWWFALGAGIASAVWFAAVGFGGRLLAPVFRGARAWRMLDAFVAVVMAATGVRLFVGV